MAPTILFKAVSFNVNRILKTYCKLIAIFLFIFSLRIWANSYEQDKHPIISANPSASFQNKNTYLAQGIPFLLEYHALTIGKQKQRFAYPQRNYNFKNDSNKEKLSFATISAFGGIYTSISNFPETNIILPGGYVATSAAGFIDSIDFDFNLAFFVEHHNHANTPSTDNQETEWVLWDNKNRKTINYNRAQAHIGLNYAWLRFEIGRDALHWGPGFYNNLTLNRQAIPYNYFSVDLVFGPLRVISFYSPLEIDSAGSKKHSHGNRNLYGHRYEIALGNATFGMSEIQAIYNENEAWLLVPVYPMFIEKGNFSEHNNNGGLAFDMNYRLMQTIRFYTEFYIDDIDSPIALIENKYLNTEWAWMIGLHATHHLKLIGHELQLGSILEYARVDQRVYTHYEPDEAQLANAGFPLGNQLGPNSQSIDLMIYGQLDKPLFIGIRNNWSWKGNVYGSDLNNIWVPDAKTPKDFLGGAKMKYALTSTLTYNAIHWYCTGSATFFAEPKVEFSIGFRL